MQIEFEKLVKAPAEYLSEYVDVIIKTLSDGQLAFPPTELIEQPITGRASDKVKFNDRLWLFVLTSIVVGTTLQALPKTDSKLLGLGTTVLLFACWVTFSVIVHFLCRAFGGTANLHSSVSSSLQVIATIYVLVNFAAFLAGALAGPNIRFIVHYALQFGLLLVYMPLALTRIQHFSERRRLAIGYLVAIAYVILNIFLLSKSAFTGESFSS